MTWSIHTIGGMFGRVDRVSASVVSKRYIAVMEPYTADRFRAAWAVLTGRAFAVRWPVTGELEAALYGPNDLSPEASAHE